MNRSDLPAPNATCEVCGQPYRRCTKCIELRNRGIETWRIHCDSQECYQAYIVLSKDIDDITKEEYDFVSSLTLPDGRKYTRDMKNKLWTVKNKFKAKENIETTQTKYNDSDQKGKTSNSKKYKYFQNGK